MGRPAGNDLRTLVRIARGVQLLRDEGNLRYEVWQPLSERVIRVRKTECRLRSSVIAADEADQNQRAKAETYGRITANQRPITQNDVDRSRRPSSATPSRD